MYSKYSIYILFCVFCCATIQAQECATRSAPLQDGPDYSVNGTATLELLSSGALVLKLSSNFATPSGPDLDVYLTNAATVATSSEVVNIAPLTSASGAQEYTIPSTINIEDYPFVVIHCTQYNHHWGHGEFSTTITVNCASLSLNEFSKQSFSIVPNPASSSIQLQQIPDLITEVRIFDRIGKQVYHQEKGTSMKEIDVSKLKKGIYIVVVHYLNSSFSKKLILN